MEDGKRIYEPVDAINGRGEDHRHDLDRRGKRRQEEERGRGARRIDRVRMREEEERGMPPVRGARKKEEKNQ